MSFQWIFDRAETISINRRSTVNQTITRGNRVRSVSAGGQIWRFEVKVPDGIPYDELRAYIESSDYLDKSQQDTIQLNNQGYDYINKYLGDSGNIVVKYPSDLTPTQLTITSSDAVSAGEFILRQGDWLQLGSEGHVYSVVADVAHDANVITVNRPVLEAANVSLDYTTILGPNVSFDVICTEFPSWTIFGYNQVSWTGAFVFYEVV